MHSDEFEVVETGAKRDTRGRIIESEEEKARILAAYDRSGLTQRVFAQREGLRYNTFVWWLQQRRRRAASPRQSAPVRFAEVALPEALPSAPSPMEVCLRDGTVIRGSSVKELAELVKALRS